MIQKIKGLIIKIWHKPMIAEKINYLVFGVFTTVVNFVVFGFVTAVFSLDYRLATFLAWMAAVVFAFITNKLFVFQSKSFNRQIMIKELLRFVAARIVSFWFDLGWMVFAVEILLMNEYIAKILSNVVVVISNYFFSKMFVFDRNDKR